MARKVEGVTPGTGGVICGVLERDQQRADPILEGAPVSVFIQARTDPSMIENFCAGQGDPLTDPDQMANRRYGQGHYTGCPIWAAGVEINNAERAFAPRERPETEGRYAGEMEITARDLAALEEPPA